MNTKSDPATPAMAATNRGKPWSFTKKYAHTGRISSPTMVVILNAIPYGRTRSSNTVVSAGRGK